MIDPMPTLYKAVVHRATAQTFLFASSRAPEDQEADALAWAKLLPLHDSPGGLTFITMEVPNGVVPGYDPGDDFHLIAIMVFTQYGGPMPTEESRAMWEGWKQDHLDRGSDLGITVDYLGSWDDEVKSPTWLIGLMNQYAISI